MRGVTLMRKASACSVGCPKLHAAQSTSISCAEHTLMTCVHACRAIFEGGLLQGFDWIAWSVVGLQVPLAFP